MRCMVQRSKYEAIDGQNRSANSHKSETKERCIALFVICWFICIILVISFVFPSVFKFRNKYTSNEPSLRLHPLSNEFIRNVNDISDSWKAGRNFDDSASMDTIKRMMGSLREPKNHNLGITLKKHSPANLRLLPTNFDARTNWPQCETIREIRDQGGCGSCWAVSAAASMSDRFCIVNNRSVRFSTEDILSCCHDCGNGCNGGYKFAAFMYWKNNGVVSGGAYNSTEGCIPYEIEPCEHHVAGHRPKCEDKKTPTCIKQCQEGSNLSYNDDKYYAKIVYFVDDEATVLKELVTNGPLECSFKVYEDFLHYKSGVYQHVSGDCIGRHAIKVIGYGVEEGLPYYLCANSWNYDWGDGGFFKIVRSALSNEMVAGIADTVK